MAIAAGSEELFDRVVTRVAFEEEERRERDRPFEQVAAHGLSHQLLISGEVQDVIDNLESHPEAVPVGP